MVIIHQASRFLSSGGASPKLSKFITFRNFSQKQVCFSVFKKLAGMIAGKLIMAYQVRSQRYGRGRADKSITLLSVRWSACSVTASGGGAESCPTVRAVSSLCLSLSLKVLTGAE